MQDTSLVTSIFPERDNSCYFKVQEQSDEGVICKTPLGYRDGKQLDGLITLKSFIEGGYELADGKILVCVKSIGGRKKCEDCHIITREDEYCRLTKHPSCHQERQRSRESGRQCI